MADYPDGASSVCAVCNETFTTIDDLITHFQTHMGDPLDEDDDAEEDSSHINLQSDQKGKPFECIVIDEECPEPFGQLAQPQSHTEERALECTLCNKKFSGNSVCRHIRDQANGKPIKCKVCKKKCLTQEGQRKHFFTHALTHSKVNYECSICDKKFYHLSNLRSHTLTHLEGHRYECTRCDRKFKDIGNLRSHMRTHKHFECKFCNKTFTDMSNLTRHLRLHTGEKPFECTFCKKKFTDSSNLGRHVQRHKERGA